MSTRDGGSGSSSRLIKIFSGSTRITSLVSPSSSEDCLDDLRRRLLREVYEAENGNRGESPGEEEDAEEDEEEVLDLILRRLRRGELL